MARAAVLALAVLLFGFPPQAEVVEDLWRGQAIITGRDNLPERARGIRLALTQVLVKVSGDDRLADHPALPGILAEAERYVLGYEYEDRKKGIQISDEQGTRDRSFYFRVDFDRQAVTRALKELGAFPWGADRPAVLAVLGVKDLRGPFVAGAAGRRGVGQTETLLLDAGRRGLPLVLPRSETAESAGVAYGTVERVVAGPLRDLAARHAADAVLAGTMAINGDGYWDTTWTLLHGEKRLQWTLPATTFDRAIADGLGRTARILAGLE